MPYTEQELILPTLSLLNQYPGGLTTSNLIKVLMKMLQPKGEDLKILNKRKDTSFSQKVRNLKSHNTLTIKGLATYEDGIFKITAAGRDYLIEKGPLYESLVRQGFKTKFIDKEIERDYCGLIIEEGALESKKVSLRKRSDILRKIAVEEYKKINNGKLPCSACNFEFSDTYGDYGADFIEIHHIEPIHEADIRGSRCTILLALKKVTLLCSNCHRMIHRKRNKMISVDELKVIIRTSAVL